MSVAKHAPEAGARPGRRPRRDVERRQERGAERRRQVLEAALRLLAREGPRAVTHRAVAREAGTSLRATTYYFASREALLTEALEHYADQALSRFARIQADAPEVETDPDPLETAVRLLAGAVVSDLSEDLGGLVAEYELVLEIRRRPELADCYARWQDALLSLLAGFAGRLGSPHPEAHARLVLATLRGLEIEALARPGAPPDPEALCDLFRLLLTGLALATPSPAVTPPGSA